MWNLKLTDGSNLHPRSRTHKVIHMFTVLYVFTLISPCTRQHVGYCTYSCQCVSIVYIAGDSVQRWWSLNGASACQWDWTEKPSQKKTWTSFEANWKSNLFDHKNRNQCAYIDIFRVIKKWFHRLARILYV